MYCKKVIPRKIKCFATLPVEVILSILHNLQTYTFNNIYCEGNMTTIHYRLSHTFILLSLTVPFAFANAQICSTKDVIDKIEQRLDKITDYQVTIKSTLNNQQPAEMVIASKIPDLLKATIKVSDNDKITLVYDKQYQWIEEGNMVYKIDLSKVKKRTPERPFNTDYSLAGGLLSGEDYIGTIKTMLSIYNLKASCNKKEIILKGDLNKEKFTEYTNIRQIDIPTAEFVNQFANTLKNATIIVNKDTYLVDKYSLVGTDKFQASFSHYDFSPLTAEQLSFKVPEGIKPIDITPGSIDSAPIPATDDDSDANK